MNNLFTIHTLQTSFK